MERLQPTGLDQTQPPEQLHDGDRPQHALAAASKDAGDFQRPSTAILEDSQERVSVAAHAGERYDRAHQAALVQLDLKPERATVVADIVAFERADFAAGTRARLDALETAERLAVRQGARRSRLALPNRDFLNLPVAERVALLTELSDAGYTLHYQTESGGRLEVVHLTPDAPDRRVTGAPRMVYSAEKEIRTESAHAGDTATPSGDAREKYHRNLGGVLDDINTVLEERKAEAIAEHEEWHKPISEMPDNNLKGVAYEGIVQRYLEDAYGRERVVPHPEGLTLSDGRAIEPDFVVLGEDGEIDYVVDAKGYTRKDVHNPAAAASRLTHLQNLEHTSRYLDVDEDTVVEVRLFCPRETASMDQVRAAVSGWSRPERPISLHSVGDEVQLKQHVQDLRRPAQDRWELPERAWAEFSRIRDLPVEQRKAEMNALLQSLTDDKGDLTAEGRNLLSHVAIERGGEGVSLIDPQTKRQVTVWYRPQE